MVREIPLTNGLVALVDDEDYERVSVFKWHAKREGYTHYAARTDRRSGEQRLIRLHREIIGAEPGQIVDHRNGNGLDCRKENLRFVNHSQNSINRRTVRTSRSGYKGVRQMESGRWRASIGRIKRVYYETFDTPEEAARAYDAKARELYGDFARLNFPES